MSTVRWAAEGALVLLVAAAGVVAFAYGLEALLWWLSGLVYG